MPMPPRPVALFRFEETAGSVAADSSATDNDGVYSADTVYDKDGFSADSRAVRFNPKRESRVTVPHNGAYALSEGTVSLYYNTRSIDGTQGMFSKQSDNGDSLSIYLLVRREGGKRAVIGGRVCRGKRKTA